MEEPNLIDALFIRSGDKEVELTLIDRPDVADAYQLKGTKFGIEVNIPDAFDGVVNDYRLIYKGVEIFSYRSQFTRLLETDNDTSLIPEETSTHVTNYERGRHVLFLHDIDEQKNTFKILSQPMIRRSFPRKIAGCEFSNMDLSSFSNLKKAMLGNIAQILIIIPSNIYPKLNRISPSFASSGKFITLYGEGGLSSETGLHEHQLNNFIMKKTQPEDKLRPYQESVVRIWGAVENYADLLFNKTENLFFVVSNGALNPRISQYVSNKIQNKRDEDIIRIRADESVTTLLNISAYSRLFDCIGSDDCWDVAIKRGLKFHDVVI